MKRRALSLRLRLCAFGIPAGAAPEAGPIEAEIVIYGGTPAGVMAAVAAARHGHTVALVDLNRHVGGVVSGGLVATDIGRSQDRRRPGARISSSAS